MFTVQAGSKRVLNAKSDKFQGNIHKRGKVQDVSPVSYPCHIALPMFAFNWSQGKARTKLGTSVVAEKQQQSCCRTNHAWLLPVCGCRFRYNSVVLKAACLPRILFACMQIAETCPPCCCSSFANYQDSNQWRQFALRQKLKVMICSYTPIHFITLFLPGQVPNGAVLWSNLSSCYGPYHLWSQPQQSWCMIV